MGDVVKLKKLLEELTRRSEEYYKWANSFDIRIDDLQFRSAIAHAKAYLQDIQQK